MDREPSVAPSPEQEPSRKEILATLRRKFAKLARWGLLASAISGLVPQELAAQESTAEQQAVIAAQFQKLELASLRVRVREQVGDETLAMIQNPPVWKAERDGGSPVPVSGFEKRPKADKAIRDVLAQVPKSLQRQISRVRYAATATAIPGSYGKMEGQTLVALADRTTHDVTFVKGADLFNENMLSGFMQHEACHFGEPSLNAGLGESDRLHVYTAILGRLTAPDRFHSAEVEGIRNANPRLQTVIKAAEYWAETCGAYLRDDKLLPDADRAIVKSVFDKTDPGASAYTRINKK